MDFQICNNGCEAGSLLHLPSPRLLKESTSSSLLSPSSPLSPSVSSPSSSTSSCEDLLVTADPLEHLDSFLRDALNSRNRITVLRLELEVEKFVRNPNQQQLLLNPMPSSYERLAAHRVAQHYHVQSVAFDSNIPPGSRILLVKTVESRLPSVKLVDIPIDSGFQAKSASPPLGKLAIKQRTREGLFGSGFPESGRGTPLRSVEERMEEYNKARARIFNDGDTANRSSEPLVFREGTCSSGPEREREDDSEVKAANTVAVFRDREKDMKDPDYDRSYDRYSQPSLPLTSSFSPSTTTDVCSSSSNSGVLVNQEGGYGQLQRQACYATSDTQGYVWVGPGSFSVMGYPSVMPSAFTQGFYSCNNVYKSNQEPAYPMHYSFVDWGQGLTKAKPYFSMPSTHRTGRFQTYD